MLVENKQTDLWYPSTSELYFSHNVMILPYYHDVVLSIPHSGAVVIKNTRWPSCATSELYQLRAKSLTALSLCANESATLKIPLPQIEQVDSCN